MSSSQGQKIQVSVRCRPLALGEVKSDVGVLSNLREIRILDRNTVKNFHFDHVFDEQDSQAEIYDLVVRPLIRQVLLGFNCTVFAYGQTGTGKTYTMEGERTDTSCDWDNDPCSGIAPRAIGEIFNRLSSQDKPFEVRVSFIELYNEDIYDLLSPIHDTTKLKVFEDSNKKGSVVVSNLEEVSAKTKEELFDVYKRGSAKRQTAATLLNACSSRSHTVFTINVYIDEGRFENEEIIKIGKLNLVDLAGSENVGRSGAQDKRAREVGNINQSLLTLGRVITALVEKRPHIPYRESKLTRLLQDALGGETKTSMIATISPAINDMDDTLSTLEYASRAQNVVNKPKQLTNPNQLKELTEYQALVARHSQEINELEYRVRNEVALEFRREMEKMKQIFEAGKAEQKSQYQAQLKDARERVERLESEVEEKSKCQDQFKERAESLELELKERDQELAQLREQVKSLELELEQKSQKQAQLEKRLGALVLELNQANCEKTVLEDRLKEFDSHQVESCKHLEEKIKELQKELEITKHLAEQRAELYQQLEDELRKSKLEVKNLRDEKLELEEQVAANPPVTKKAKVRQRPLLEEATCDYANMTFDGGDEITQASGKKTRKKIVNCGRNKELVLSGKKQKIKNNYDEAELSPIPQRQPTRITRAARRKLDFENDDLI